MGAAPRVVVTGAGGFAGTWLCRQLVAQGAEVVGWVRQPPRHPVAQVKYRILGITHSIDCIRALEEDRPDQLYHLAALTHLGEAEADPERAWQVNVVGTRNVLEPLPPGCRVVLASTCHVYGPPRQAPVDEDHPLQPQGVYACTKAEAERVALAVHPNTVLARAFHHTGPGQSPRFALADWAAQLEAARPGEPPPPLRVGDLDRVLDYSDVRDVVRGYTLLAERAAPGAVVNLCSGEGRSLRALLALLLGDTPAPVVVDPARVRPGGWAPLVGDPRRAQALGFWPAIPILQTLRDLRAAARAGSGG